MTLFLLVFHPPLTPCRQVLYTIGHQSLLMLGINMIDFYHYSAHFGRRHRMSKHATETGVALMRLLDRRYCIVIAQSTAIGASRLPA